MAHGLLSGVWGSGRHQHLCPVGQQVNEAGRQGVTLGGVVEQIVPLSFGGIWYRSGPSARPSHLSPVPALGS